MLVFAEININMGSVDWLGIIMNALVVSVSLFIPLPVAAFLVAKDLDPFHSITSAIFRAQQIEFDLGLPFKIYRFCVLWTIATELCRIVVVASLLIQISCRMTVSISKRIAIGSKRRGMSLATSLHRTCVANVIIHTMSDAFGLLCTSTISFDGLFMVIGNFAMFRLVGIIPWYIFAIILVSNSFITSTIAIGITDAVDTYNISKNRVEAWSNTAALSRLKVLRKRSRAVQPISFVLGVGVGGINLYRLNKASLMNIMLGVVDNSLTALLATQ
jgi:hypothetical protein